MTAWLRMYDQPHVRAANENLWAGTRSALLAEGCAAPATLSRSDDYWAVWRDPDLVLAQTCALPFSGILHLQTHLVATPDYGLQGCPPGYYRSHIVVRADDPRSHPREFHGSKLAYNGEDSMSGWQALRDWAMRSGIILRPTRKTGSHEASANAVAKGAADIAAIDAHTCILLQKSGLWPDGLRVIDNTEPRPGLPLITATKHDPDLIRAGLQTGLDGLAAQDRDALGIRSLVHFDVKEYLAA